MDVFYCGKMTVRAVRFQAIEFLPLRSGVFYVQRSVVKCSSRLSIFPCESGKGLKLFRSSTTREASRQVAVFVTASLVRPRRPESDSALAKRPAIKLVGREQFEKALRESLERLKRERS